MKKLVLWFFLLTLAVYAGAQQTINFADLPDVGTATPLPTGYHSLTWSGVSYVDPFKATGMGLGFQHSGSIAGTDVAFGPRVCGGLGCYSSITSASGGHFQLVNAHRSRRLLQRITDRVGLCERLLCRFADVHADDRCSNVDLPAGLGQRD